MDFPRLVYTPTDTGLYASNERVYCIIAEDQSSYDALLLDPDNYATYSEALANVPPLPPEGGTEAEDVTTDFSLFDNNLSSSDDTLQKALDTLDDLSAGGVDWTATQESSTTPSASATAFNFRTTQDWTTGKLLSVGDDADEQAYIDASGYGAFKRLYPSLASGAGYDGYISSFSNGSLALTNGTSSAEQLTLGITNNNWFALTNAGLVLGRNGSFSFTSGTFNIQFSPQTFDAATAAGGIKLKAQDVWSGATTFPNGGNVEIESGDGSTTGNGDGGDISVTLGSGGGTGSNGNLKLTNIPTSDPAVAGAVWNDSGTLKISAG